MKPMLAAFAACAFITVAAPYVLGEFGFSSADRGTGAAVRLGQ